MVEELDKEIQELNNRILNLERTKKISNLKERLNKIEGKEEDISKESKSHVGITGNPVNYRPLVENLQDGFSNLKDNFDKIPHLIVNNKKEESKIVKEQPIFNEKEQKTINSVKKWGLIIGVLIIVGYASFRVLKGWLF
jgi:DNA repair exonuclease SbcCD ATPase subunit